MARNGILGGGLSLCLACAVEALAEVRDQSNHRDAQPCEGAGCTATLGAAILSPEEHSNCRKSQQRNDCHRSSLPSESLRQPWEQKPVDHSTDVTCCRQSEHEPLDTGRITAAGHRQGDREARSADTEEYT